jgi:urease accessory protein
MPKTSSSMTLAVMLAVLPHAAWAHHVMDGSLPRTFIQGLLSGLGHPLIGLDHAAFIVAAGFLLALIKGGMWGILALIVGCLLGAALHLGGMDLTGGEAGVALSVILVGGLVISRRQIALPWLAGGLAIAGVLHGHAYAESIFGAEPAPLIAYLIGFSIMQLGVATVALRMHRRLMTTRGRWLKPLSATLGAAVGAIGVVFLAINIGA